MKTDHSDVISKLKSLFLILLVSFSCTSRSTDGNDNDTLVEEIEYEQDSEPGVSMNMAIIYDEEEIQSNLLRYKIENKNDTVYISPSSGYFEEFCSDKLMTFYEERDIVCSDYIQNPKLLIYLTNNSNKTISCKGVRANIHSSSLDTFPLLYIPQHVIFRYAMEILNECWTNWGTLTLNYSFEKKDKPFDGKYDYTINIPYFTDRIIIDFRSDLLKEGFNPDKVDKYLKTFDEEPSEFYEEKDIHGHNANIQDLKFAYIDPELELTSNDLTELAYPFEYGFGMEFFPFIFTRIHARLSFSKSNFTKEITGIIPLTCYEPGGASDEIVDDFNIILKPEGENYFFTLPYFTTLRPGQSETIQLNIKCEKSSHHEMDIQLIDDQDQSIISCPIRFYNINGRHSSYHVLKSWEE